MNFPLNPKSPSYVQAIIYQCTILFYALTCLILWMTFGIEMVCKSNSLFQNLFFFLWSIAENRSAGPMDDKENSKKNYCSRCRWAILILLLFLISAVVLTIVFVLQTKHNSQPLVMNTSNISVISGTYNVSDEEYYSRKTFWWMFCFIIDFYKRFIDDWYSCPSKYLWEKSNNGRLCSDL
jgi:hypothetical protein